MSKPEFIQGKWVVRRPWASDVDHNCFACAFCRRKPDDIINLQDIHLCGLRGTDSEDVECVGIRFVEVPEAADA